MQEDAALLLVDDSEEDILLVRRALERANITNPVRVVRGGDEAIQYLGGNGQYADRNQYPMPSLMLLDLRMPGRDGYEVMEWVGAQPAMRGLRIIVLTSLDSKMDVDRAYKLGAASFLIKPVDFEDLVSLLRTLSKFWVGTSELPKVGAPDGQGQVVNPS